MANTTKKNEVTEIKALEYVIATCDDAEIKEKLEKMLATRQNRTTKVDEEKVARDGEYKNAIIAHLLDGKKYTPTELTKAVTLINADGLSTSKVTNLLTALKNEGLVVNKKEKGKSYYSIADVTA